jgi:hypothetical protein
MTKKRNVLTIKTYEVLCRAVEEGVSHGMRRAYKHQDKPSQEDIISHMENQVLSAICEYFSFPEEAGKYD